jgi:hypothetical protein
VRQSTFIRFGALASPFEDRGSREIWGTADQGRGRWRLGIKDVSGDEDEVDRAGIAGRQDRADELRGTGDGDGGIL